MNTDFPVFSVVETHIDVENQQFVATVGSWPEGADGPPRSKTAVTFHISTWLPEYGLQANDFLLSSPDWGGVGPARPSDLHVWAPVTLDWFLPLSALQDAKDAKWAAIKKSRAASESGGFDWDGSPFQSNLVSQQRINANVLFAIVNPDFVVEWVLADNSSRSLSAPEMINIGIALKNHLALQFDKSQLLRSAIACATTLAQVRAVCWSGQ